MTAASLALSACDGTGNTDGGDGVGVIVSQNAGAQQLSADSIAGSWTLAIDTSDAARESIGAGGTGKITISVMPSAPVDDFGAEASADANLMRYGLDIESDGKAITRCAARDLSEAGQTFVTVSCKLDKDRLIITLGSEENGGVMRNELSRLEENGPLEGRTLMVAKALPMDVVVGKASLTLTESGDHSASHDQ